MINSEVPDDMNISSSLSPPARGLVLAGALALVIGLMKLAAPLLSPILLAIFIAIVATPVLTWMRRKRVPRWAALVLIAFVLLDVGSLLALVATGALEGFRDSIPTYQERFMVVAQQLGNWLERVGVEGSTQAIPDLMAPSKLMGVIRPVLSNASGILASGLLVLLAVIFILLEAPSLPAKLKAAFAIDEAGEARIRRLLFSINRYMRIKAMTSLATALCAWALLWLLGIDFAPLWALLAFFLNFVPVVGNIVMMIPPTLLAVVQVGPGAAVVVAAGYLIINTAIGNVIEPRIMGKGLGISTLTVFLALLFWGWLFGVVGMFLAVPLTAAVIIALDASPHTRPIAILLGPEIKTAPPTVNAPVIDAVVEDELPERADPAAKG